MTPLSQTSVIYLNVLEEHEDKYASFALFLNQEAVKREVLNHVFTLNYLILI